MYRGLALFTFCVCAIAISAACKTDPIGSSRFAVTPPPPGDGGMAPPPPGDGGMTPPPPGDGGMCLDEDGDGITTCDGDCDDLDASQGNQELCGDAQDNDCDGAADEGCDDIYCPSQLDTVVQITAGSQYQSPPAVSGSRLVWLSDSYSSYCGDSSYRQVYLKDVANSCATPGGAITLRCSDKSGVAISGDVVVWNDISNGKHHIYRHQIGGGAPAPISDVARESFPKGPPAISGERVVWQEGQDVWLYDPPNPAVKISLKAASGAPKISGNYVVWRQLDGIVLYDINAQTLCNWAGEAGPNGDPAISGNRVVWWGPTRLKMVEYAGCASVSVQTVGDTYSTPPGPPSISGARIVYRSGNEILFDLNTPTAPPRLLIPHLEVGSVLSDPHIAGYRIVWSKGFSSSHDVYYYELTPPTPVGEPTPRGLEVPVSPTDPTTASAPVEITFAQVTTSGPTTVVTSEGDDQPALPDEDFSLGDPPTVYDIHTYAAVTAPIRVCINYSGVSFSNPCTLQLMHHGEHWSCSPSSPCWYDATICNSCFPSQYCPLDSNTICAMVDSLSPFAIVVPKVKTVAIDIKPGSSDNTINLGSAGKIPVGILSSPTFDAATVLPDTVKLSGASVSLVGNGNKLLCSTQQIDGIGAVDMLCHVETDQLQLTTGSSSAVLTASTSSGGKIRGEDLVTIVP